MKRPGSEKLMARVQRLERQLSSYRDKLREAREHLRKQERKNRQIELLLKEFPGYLVLIQDERILFANNKVLTDLGYSAAEVQGKAFYQFIYRDSLDLVRKIYRKRLRGEAVPSTYDLNLVDKRGNGVPCEARVSRIRYGGRKAFLVGLTPLKERNATVAENLRKEKLEAISRFCHGIVHQLRSCTELLEKCMGETSHQSSHGTGDWALLSEVATSHKRLVEMLGVLHDVQSGAQETVELPKLVRQAEDIARKLVIEMGGRTEAYNIETFIRAKTISRCDPRPIAQAIANVIANAIEAVPPDGAVLVTLEESAGLAHIYVQDNGPGIAPEDKDKIFDPFYTTKPDHLGMGLSIAAAIFRKYEGYIEVDSHPGHGTIFSLTLPAIERPKAVRMPPPGKIIKGRRIMITGGHDSVVTLLAEVIRNKGGIVVVPTNFSTAFKLIKGDKVDLAIVALRHSRDEYGHLIRKMVKMDNRLPLICLTHQGGFMGDTLDSTHTELNTIFLTGPVNVDEVVRVVTQRLAAQDQ